MGTPSCSCRRPASASTSSRRRPPSGILVGRSPRGSAIEYSLLSTHPLLDVDEETRRCSGNVCTRQQIPLQPCAKALHQLCQQGTPCMRLRRNADFSTLVAVLAHVEGSLATKHFLFRLAFV